VAGGGSACDGGVVSAGIADAGFAGEFISDGSGRCDATADRGPLSTGAFVRAKLEPLMAIVAPARRPAKITGANFAVRFAIRISDYAIQHDVRQISASIWVAMVRNSGEDWV
jgi:hypothetical protein